MHLFQEIAAACQAATVVVAETFDVQILDMQNDPLNLHIAAVENQEWRLAAQLPASASVRHQLE